jgi:hypothetical protein
MSTKLSKLQNRILGIHQDTIEECFNEIATRVANLKSAYHYTSLSASAEIIRTGKLRFSSVRYLNDPLELKEGLDIARKVGSEKINELQTLKFPNTANWLTTMLVGLELILRTPSERNDAVSFWSNSITFDLNSLPKPVEVYVSSFSLKEDDLGQWLAYGDGCSGCVLEFSVRNDQGKALFSHDGNDITAVNVNYYNDYEKEHFAKRLLTEVINSFTVNLTEDRKPSEQEYRDIWSSLMGSLLIDVAACKSEPFANEDELRFIHVAHGESNEQNFMVKDGLLKPYIDVDFDKSFLKTVKLGCKIGNELNKMSFDKLLKQSNYTNVIVDMSKLKFR